MYFNVNFNVFFKLIKVHLLVSELYTLQEIRNAVNICFTGPCCTDIIATNEMAACTRWFKYDRD